MTDTLKYIDEACPFAESLNWKPGMAFKYVGGDESLKGAIHYFVGFCPVGASSAIFVASIPGQQKLHWMGFAPDYERWPEHDADTLRHYRDAQGGEEYSRADLVVIAKNLAHRWDSGLAVGSALEELQEAIRDIKPLTRKQDVDVEWLKKWRRTEEDVRSHIVSFQDLNCWEIYAEGFNDALDTVQHHLTPREESE